MVLTWLAARSVRGRSDPPQAARARHATLAAIAFTGALAAFVMPISEARMIYPSLNANWISPSIADHLLPARARITPFGEQFRR